jgi:NAD(P)H-dependent FMN reductase
VARKQAQSGGTRRERITRLLAEVEKNLKAEKMKVTLADFIRLTQLERELEQDEQPKEIIVTWKNAAEGRSDSK